MKKTSSIIFLFALSANAFSQNFFSVSISPTVTDVNDVNALFKYQDGTSSVSLAFQAFDTAPVGQTTSLTIETNVPLSTLTYGLLGSYGTQGVTLGVDSTTATALVGRPWESIFTNPAFAEANVRAALDSNDVAFTFLFVDYLSTVEVATPSGTRGLLSELGQDVAILNFSDASRNGFANIQVVPEPATLAALGLGISVLLRRKRKAA